MRLGLFFFIVLFIKVHFVDKNLSHLNLKANIILMNEGRLQRFTKKISK